VTEAVNCWVVPVWSVAVFGVTVTVTTPAGTHVPTLQTEAEPHPVPSGRLVPESAQTGAPELQTSAPEWQGLLGVHVFAGVQGGPTKPTLK
jgi:hypothetical protein